MKWWCGKGKGKKADTGNTEIIELRCWCIENQMINVAGEICTWT